MFDLPEESFKKPETLPELIAYIEGKEIVCPTHYWDKLYNRIRLSGSDYLNPPLILAGSIASDKKKYDRFMEYLQRADELGVLEDAINYLGRLKREEDFHYSERPLHDGTFAW